MRQLQYSLLLVAMEAEWSRADILKLINRVPEEKLLIVYEHCSLFADTNLKPPIYTLQFFATVMLWFSPP